MAPIARVLAALTGALATANTGRVPLKTSGDAIPNEYIAVFKQDIAVPQMKAFAESIGATRTYEFGGKLKMMYGVWRPEFVEVLRERTDLFEFIEQNQVIRTFARQTNGADCCADFL